MADQIHFQGINLSVQIGDKAYFAPTVGQGSFSTALTSTAISIGTIIDISRGDVNASPNPNYIQVDNPNGVVIPVNAFIMFTKDNSVNSTEVLGYYAKAKFINDSDTKFELFSIGSEISLSSK